MKAMKATGASVASSCEPEGELSSGPVAEESYSVRVNSGAKWCCGETGDGRRERKVTLWRGKMTGWTGVGMMVKGGRS